MSFANFINTENAAAEFERLSREDQLEIRTLYAATERAVAGIQAHDQSIAPTIYKIAKKQMELTGEDGGQGSLPPVVGEIMVVNQQNEPMVALIDAIQGLVIPFDGTPVIEWSYTDQRQHWLSVLFTSSRRKGVEAGFCTMATRALEHVPLRAPAW